jgi:hypothetical protein
MKLDLLKLIERRRITLKQWVQENKITTVEAFLEKTTADGLSMPFYVIKQVKDLLDTTTNKRKIKDLPDMDESEYPAIAEASRQVFESGEVYFPPLPDNDTVPVSLEPEQPRFISTKKSSSKKH